VLTYCLFDHGNTREASVEIGLGFPVITSGSTHARDSHVPHPITRGPYTTWSYVPPPCRLGGVLVSVLDTGPKDYGFEPGQGEVFFKGDKIPQHTFLLDGK
jgi:hypothetical protein